MEIASPTKTFPRKSKLIAYVIIVVTFSEIDHLTDRGIMKKLIFAAIAGIALTSSANAASVFTFNETNEGVVGVLSGTLDLTGATSLGSFSVISDPIVRPALGFFAFQSIPSPDVSGYAAVSPSAFGSGNFTGATSFESAEESLSVGSGGVFLSPDYISGTEMDGTVTFGGETYASIGITPGDYVWTLPNDTFTLSFQTSTVAPIPLPASFGLLIAAIGAIGFAKRRAKDPV